MPFHSALSNNHVNQVAYISLCDTVALIACKKNICECEKKAKKKTWNFFIRVCCESKVEKETVLQGSNAVVEIKGKEELLRDYSTYF